MEVPLQTKYNVFGIPQRKKKKNTMSLVHAIRSKLNIFFICYLDQVRNDYMVNYIKQHQVVHGNAN